MESEFSKSFQKQMQSYLTNNKTALVLDEWQKQVSGKGRGEGRRGWKGLISGLIGQLSLLPSSSS